MAEVQLTVDAGKLKDKVIEKVLGVDPDRKKAVVEGRKFKQKMSEAQRQHELILEVLKTFRESPEICAWAVLLGGTGLMALMAQITGWQNAGKPDDQRPEFVNADGTIDWTKLVLNAGTRGLLGPWSLVIPGDLTEATTWQGVIGGMVVAGPTGVAAAYLILSAMSGGARGGKEGGGALGDLSKLFGLLP